MNKVVKIICVLFIFSLFSCASTQKLEPYYESNIGDFTQKELSNGINVIFKQSHGSRLSVLRMIFDGGVAYIPAEKSGIEGITLNLMMHGSENFSYTDIQKLIYEKNFSLASSSAKDFSIAGFTCIQRDFYDVLDIFSDGILNPLFDKVDFDNEIKSAQAYLKRVHASPENLCGRLVSLEIFKNHPYKTLTSVTDESVKAINLDDVKNHYKSLLNANRIKIVVVGNFTEEDVNNITKILDDKFSAIQKDLFEEIEIPSLTFDTDSVYAANEQAGEIGYITGVFKSPERGDPEYLPFAISLMILDDIFYSEVREKRSAVYSIGTGVIGGKKLLGAVSVFKASEKESLKKYILDAIGLFPNEKEIAEKLDQCKNKYISKIFSNGQNNSGVAANITSSLIYNKDATVYLHRSAEIQKVSAKQVYNAYKKYIQPVATENSAKWFVVSGEKSLHDFKFD